MKLRAAVALLAVCALAGAGCGSSAQEGPPTRLIVSQDFGTSPGAAETVPLTKGLTALRQLETVKTVKTSYGGRYVTTIGDKAEDQDSSWLFFVDGIESKVGASSVRLKPNQVVQWDLHPWQSVRGGGAIIGAYPRPLKQRGVKLVCAPRGSEACRITREELSADGIIVDNRSPVRVIVGPWSYIDGFDGVPDLTTDGAENGAYAQFSNDGEKLSGFSADGSSAQKFAEGAGLLAAFATDNNPVWVITGTDDKGVENAARLLDGGGKKIQQKFAMIATGRLEDALPEVTGR